MSKVWSIPYKKFVLEYATLSESAVKNLSTADVPPVDVL